MIDKFKITLPISLGIVLLIYFLFDVYTAVNVLIIVIISHSLLFLFYLLEEERKIREADKYFPVFLKNLSRNVGAKVPIIKALIETSKQKYGNLTRIFYTFARKLEAGINVKNAFDFLISKFKENKKIKNGLTILKEAFTTGYGIKEIIDGVYNYIVKISSVEIERKGLINQYIVLFYAISLIFLVITIFIIRIMVPIFSSFVENMQRQGQYVEIPCEVPYTPLQSFVCSLYENEMKLFKKEYKYAEFYLFGLLFTAIIIQSFFSGIIIGIGIERSLIKGLIHSLILFSITFFTLLLLGKIGFL